MIRGKRNPIPTKPKPMGAMFKTHERTPPAPHTSTLTYAKGAGEAKHAPTDKASRRHQKHYGKAHK